MLQEGTAAAEVKKYLDTRSVVLNQGQFWALGDIWQYPKTLLIVTVGELLLEFSRQRIGMLLNILQCTRKPPLPPTKISKSKMSIVSKQRNCSRLTLRETGSKHEGASPNSPHSAVVSPFSIPY